MKNKIIISSILTIAMCLSLIAGSTFALFTSESKVNVAVTSGKVEVVATADNLQVGSSLDSALGEAKFETVAGIQTLTISNFVPGDYVSFDIHVQNNSNVGIKYRTVLSVTEEADTALFEALDVRFGENAAKYDGKTQRSAWVDLAPTNHPQKVTVTVSFPDAVNNNDFMGKTCTISYKVEAVQGNANAVNDEDSFVAAIENGFDEIVLSNDIVLDNALVIDEPISIDLDGNELSVLGFDVKSDMHISNGEFTSADTLIMLPHLRIDGGKLTMDNVNVKIDDYMNYYAQDGLNYTENMGISVENGAELVLNDSNIIVENKLVSTWNYSYGIALYNGTVTMNGGSIVILSAGAVREDHLGAISSMGNDTVTLNNVQVTADVYAMTMRTGNLTLNTTDSTVTANDIDTSLGGRYTLNIIP
jgi:predicted ribosomally synthesized peptide with SipW-like signal peptide